MRKLLGVALPSALLAVLITAACDVGAPVSSELLPNFLDAGGTLGCPDDFDIRTQYGIGVPPDRNEDGVICEKRTSQQYNANVIQIDNNVPGGRGGCPTGFTLVPVYVGGAAADRNKDGNICTKTTASGRIISIDNTN